MAQQISQAPQGSNPDTVLGIGWQQFFNLIVTLLGALTQSGTTAQRPIKVLWIGRTYFDTTLGIPIWYRGLTWVNASGSVV